MRHRVLKEPPGLHHLMAGVVNARRAVIHRTDDRELVGVLRDARQQFTDLQPGHTG
jgi:hypothetical protein